MSNSATMSQDRLSSGYRLSHPPPGDEVLITGISGKFPDSDNITELRDNLFNKVDLITSDDRRWKLAHPEIPQRTGKINEVNKFDASFFGVHYKQAHTMDPMCRILLEKAYEAVIDSGTNPRELKNSKTGVFIGACFSESEKTWFYEKMQVNGFGITGCSRAMLANRISYWLGTTGPSYTVDSACSSSLYAIEHAFRSIRDGHCDAAIVGGSNLCLHPYVSLQFSRLGVLSQGGKCKSFDKDADGYARSEAISVCFLQKAKDSRRVYAQILHAKTNCDGYKEQGITYPAGHIQKLLLSEFYEECLIPPKDLEFVEAHGTGTRVGDPEELIAINEIFCTGRSGPLNIGSVKSNLGHSEPASGLCSIAKICIAYDTGFLPPNLHFNEPRKDVPALLDGRLNVITEKTPWGRGMAGVNSFGFGGANAHVLLSNYAKPKVNNGLPTDDLPRLICVSGRVEAGVARLLDDAESRPVDVEHVRLLQAIHEEDINGHVVRGFTLLAPRPTGSVRLSRDIQYFSGTQCPVWFVFSGMGSQWPGMGTQLMRIPVFAAAIHRCHKVLESKGIDLMTVITSPDPKIFDNILHSFVGIAAIQIGLCDVLSAIGIEPDFIIGHSVGELGCAYADGGFTAEQMILAAYSRGLASIQTPFIKGSMAAIGIGYQQAKELCPPDIEVACHNSADSCTISGPADSMTAFVAKLTAEGIFAKEVPCANIAFHSSYIAEAGPTLLKYLREVIPNPKPRSAKWLSTSVPQTQWKDKKAELNSAEYHTNNLLNSVLFEETSRLVPANAITIEIAPHGLLQAILRRSMKPGCTNVALTKRWQADNVEVLFTAIGKLYESGLNPTMANIYPKVEFPVSTGTPMLSHLVEWDHSEDWYVTSYRSQEKMKSGERTVRMSIADEDCEYLGGHVIDGRNLYPATGYLVLVWETLGMMMGELYTEVSVVFENVSFKRATNIPHDGNLEFIIMIQKGSGNFEVVESGAAIVTGKIFAQKNVSQTFRIWSDPPSESHVTTLATKDIYKELKLRGYHYSGDFRSMISSNIEGNHGFISWNNNWVPFMDTMLQMKILSNDTRSLFVPTRIERLSIDVTVHYNDIAEMTQNLSDHVFEVKSYSDVDVIRCSGVEIRGLHASPIARRNPLGIPLLEKYQFVPNLRPEKGDIDDILKCNVLMVLENVQTVKVKVLELADEAFKAQSSEIIAEKIADILADVPLIHAEIVVVSDTPMDANPKYTVENKKLAQETNTLIFVGTNLLKRPDELKLAIGTLRDKGFLISREAEFPDIKQYADQLHILTVANTGEEHLVLMRKRVGSKPAKFVHVQTSDLTFSWVEKVKEVMKDSGKVVLVSENEPLNGLLGLVNCLRREPGGEIVYGLMISDPSALPFNPDLPFYEDLLDKDLALNVLVDGKWGTYRHLALGDMSNVLAEHAFVNVKVFGDLTSLSWFEGPLKINKRILKQERQLFHVYYSALNFRDVMTATGRISVDAVARGRLNQVCVQGLEFCGRTVDGRRMMGMVASSGLANMVEADDFMLWPMPDAWSMAEACTVPVAYGTIYYAMIMVGAMQRGETVLIHAGSGGVGQAAIHVCLHYGCNIFTTVGTPEKRAFIKKMFPQLKDSQIGNSRDTSFEEMVRLETGGKGVDIVLNSLAEEKLQASIRCLGYKGRFLEIGKFDITNNTAVGMGFFLREASFHGIMMDFLFEQTSDARKKLQDMLQDGIVSGAVKPLVSVEFGKDEVEKAFRYMAAGKHIGKVLIKIREEEKDRIVKPRCHSMEAVPRYICHGDDSYVIVGGLGGFGLELADWLVLRGARKLVINSRRGISNGYQASRLRVWRSYGAEVVVSTDDVTTEEGCVSLLEKASKVGVVRGIFNLAVVLKDSIFANQTPETFAASFGPKAIATKHLDHVSRRICPQLQDFVIFSSVSCGRGNAGQTNYGMANGVMERICEWRRKLGLPALAVQWGAVGEVGLVADMQLENHELEIAGTLQQRVSSCLDVLDQFLRQTDAPVVACMVVAEKRLGGLGSGGMVETIANIMGIKDLKKVSQQVSLAELGMDSIMAVEIQQCLEREFEISLTAQDIRTLTFGRLHELSQTREDEASPQAMKKVIDTQVGLKVLLRNFGDPMLASEPLINMVTMTSDGKEGEDVIYDPDTTVFMVPGVEGMSSVLETISKRIRAKACVLQLGYEHFNESIEDIANRLVVQIRLRLLPGIPFTILGYSFGAHVALEIAAILESEGHVGTVFCLDGSPDFLYAFLHLTINVSNENLLQSHLLCHVLEILSPQGNQAKDLMPVLETVETFEQKIDIFLTHLPDNDFTRHQSQCLATVVYDRIMAVKNYEQKNLKKLKSPIILMRPKETPPNMVVDENYGLDKCSEQIVKVHFLEGNHVSIVENKDCANIINRVLIAQKQKSLEKDAVKSGQYAYTDLVKQQVPEQLK